MEIIYSIIGIMFGIACTYDYLKNEFKSPVRRMSTTFGVAFICVFPIAVCLWPLLLLIIFYNAVRK